MMRFIVCFTAGLVLLLPTGSFAERPPINLNLLVGIRSMDEDDWELIDTPVEFGIEMDGRNPDWWVNLVGGLRLAVDADEEDVVIPGVGSGEITYAHVMTEV